MRVVSVNVGMPKTRIWRGRYVSTAIFKGPVAGRVPIRRLNLDGDAQADLTVHGGPDKAVYAYPSEHYDAWRAELPGRELPPGVFGENLTTEGILEASTHVGDEFRVGTARLVVTQPRLPCYKLGLRFEDPSMVKRFLAAGRPGIYFAVLDEGDVAAGDPIERVREDEHRVGLVEVFRMLHDPGADPGAIRRVLAVPALAASIREELEARLAG